MKGVKSIIQSLAIKCGWRFFLPLAAALVLAVPALAEIPTPAPSTQAQINTKSSEIEKLEQEITQFGKEIQTRQTKQRTLKNDIAILDTRIKKAQLEIKRLGLLIDGLNSEILEREASIAEKEKDIVRRQAIIASQLLTLSQDTYQPSILLYVVQGQFSDFFGQLQALETLEARLHSDLVLVRSQKQDLEKEKEELGAQKAENEGLKDIQVATQETLTKNSRDKQQLLTVTKGEEKKFQELVKTSKANVEKLKNEIYYLQKIGVTAEQAATLGVLVANRIGIRPAFLIAILEIESRLGANVGKGTWKVDMAPRDYDAFSQICRELGLNPDTTPVSKKPSYGWGGALGPAQFLPTTWLGYRSQVSAYTGRTPANPWNIEDAFFAAALKLAKDGASTRTTSGELAAAKAYISGSPLCTKSVCNYYANLAIDKAADIEQTLR